VSAVTGRRGATFSDVLLFLSTLGLAAALAYPAWSAREFRGRVSMAIADVEAVSAAARRSLDASGRWPDPAPPGVAPADLTGLTGEGGAFARTAYRIGWTSWNIVDSTEVVQPAPAPEDTPPEYVGPVRAPVLRSIGAVTVHSGDLALLAELTESFSDGATFVLDTMWLLVLPQRAVGPVTER
jgi:hypothetical protein